MLAAEKALRRRSVGIFPGPTSHAFDAMEHMFRVNDSSTGSSAAGNTLPLDPIPFYLPGRVRTSSDVSNSTSTTAALGNEMRSPGSSQASRPSTKDSTDGSPSGPALYEKLNKGEPGLAFPALAFPRGQATITSRDTQPG
ncbi:putative zinc-type alcohol dehydrogenase-like protein YogA [Fusarium oxysporum f. sp. albedinis]|nr:putative zinc-type alcohol dehydrogenase-like protein YogA [Fusarium oxysporum f. sp. albedinis]